MYGFSLGLYAGCREMYLRVGACRPGDLRSGRFSSLLIGSHCLAPPVCFGAVVDWRLGAH